MSKQKSRIKKSKSNINQDEQNCDLPFEKEKYFSDNVDTAPFTDILRDAFNQISEINESMESECESEVEESMESESESEVEESMESESESEVEEYIDNKDTDYNPSDDDSDYTTEFGWEPPITRKDEIIYPPELDELSRDFVCSVCSGSFKDAHKLFVHEYERHTKVSCLKCNTVCDNFIHVKMHYNNVHNIKYNMNCFQCDRNFKTNYHLIIHQSKCKIIKCEHCGRLVRIAGRANHKCYKERNRDFKTQCDGCGSMNSNHLCRKCTPTTKRQCTVCNKQFASVISLKHHMLTHDKKNQVECSVCGKTLGSHFMLGRHMVKVHNGRNYLCQSCGKTFTTLNNLKQHRIIHGVGNLFSCSICSKRFTQRWYCKVHERSHRNQLPFSCKICAKTFAHSTFLKKHMKIHKKQ